MLESAVSYEKKRVKSQGTDYKFIDIAKIVEESNSEMLKRLPGFIVRIIAWIVRQDEMNRILQKYSECTGKEFLVKIIEEFNLTIEVDGKENLPEDGKCFFVANHPFGVIDGLVLTHTISGKYRELKAIANDSFMFIPQLRPLIAAVNVFDSPTKIYAKALDDVYNSDIPITHFPSGEVSRRYNGKVQDTAWQKSFIKKAISSRRDIVPIFIYGRNSRLFYFINSSRRLLGIKTNIELLLLPREMFRKKNKTIRIRIGTPISYLGLDDSATHRDEAQKVRSFVYELGNNG
ncbi:MAG: 1-acyl-sn-glycerol-3-phosphate acyltransferase [Bacteroidota bacterium]